jgi:ABC-type methionine transport system permease subunit
VFGVPIGLNVLNGGVILALMSVPIIVSIGEDALKAVPDSYREAALALGVTRWQMVYRVLLPAALTLAHAVGRAGCTPASPATGEGGDGHAGEGRGTEEDKAPAGDEGGGVENGG